MVRIVSTKNRTGKPERFAFRIIEINPFANAGKIYNTYAHPLETEDQ
jgi:hypothetical protein